MWIRFNDMHSGGGLKVPPYESLYLWAESVDKGVDKFISMFHRNPTDTACHTCGQNYSIDSDEDLRQLSAFDRRLRFAHPRAADRNAAWKEGRYLEPDEDLPKGWTLSFSRDEPGATMKEFLASEAIYVERLSDLEYLARREIPPWGQE